MLSEENIKSAPKVIDKLHEIVEESVEMPFDLNNAGKVRSLEAANKAYREWKVIQLHNSLVEPFELYPGECFVTIKGVTNIGYRSKPIDESQAKKADPKDEGYDEGEKQLYQE